MVILLCGVTVAEDGETVELESSPEEPEGRIGLYAAANYGPNPTGPLGDNKAFYATHLPQLGNSTTTHSENSSKYV